MKLKAQITPYSSIVGGGLMLTDEAGRARFVVNVVGTTEGITKAESAAISEALAAGVASGIDVPERA